jgi:hypothetical protein
MDELRIALAAATGAIIGGMVVVALSWTLRTVAQPAGAPGEHGGIALRRRPLHWLLKLAILVLSIGGYAYVGYSNRPLAPAAASASTPASPLAQAAIAPTQFAVGGVDLSFTPPSGYCLYPEALQQTVVAQQATLNPGNVIHVIFADCDELHDAADTRARIRDFGMLMTPKAQLDRPVGPADLDRIVAGATDTSAAKETLDQRLHEAQSRLRLQSFSSLGELDHDADAAYFAYLFHAKDEKGGFDQACVMALTTLKGRLVSYYLYSDYSRDARPALQLLLHRVKASLGDMMARNS